MMSKLKQLFSTLLKSVLLSLLLVALPVGGYIAYAMLDYHYGTRSLVGASDAQLAHFAVEYFQQMDMVHGTPTVLLARQVTRTDLAALGFGCLAQPGSIEQPPLALVVMKGDFMGMDLGVGSSHYAGVVFDEWAASPAFIRSSFTGTGFGTVLNDPGLDTGTTTPPTVCPTDEPRYLHYGDTVPTAAVPTGTVKLPPIATPAYYPPVAVTTNVPTINLTPVTTLPVTILPDPESTTIAPVESLN